MLSYQHGYHAGNFADIIKHIAHTQICRYLCKKPKPFFYLETHSGRGFYTLTDPQSLKTSEYRQGAALIWEKRKQAPDVLSPFLDVLKSANPGSELKYYPGSPSIAISTLRSEDRLFFVEKHPREFEFLTTLSRQKKRVFFSHSDGLEQLKALIPPPERRGYVFIDPSFEMKEEYKEIPRAISAAHARFSGGTFMLWYPITDNRLHARLLRGMSAVPAPDFLKIEFIRDPDMQSGMRGCGLWIINPPYTLQQEMQEILSFLCTLFNPGKSQFTIENTVKS